MKKRKFGFPKFPQAFSVPESPEEKKQEKKKIIESVLVIPNVLNHGSLLSDIMKA